MKRKDFWQAVVVGLFTLIFVLMPLTFFIPLGSHPTAFEVVEESLRDFRAAQINELDKRLRDAAQ